jgi:O-antigen/teichoic acid export membrane protein
MMGQIPKSEPAEDGALAYGIKTSFYASFNAMAVQVDKLMIFLCLSPAALAIYVVAEKVPEGIKALIGDLALVIGPRLSKHNEYTPRLEKIFLIFSIVAGTGIIAIAFLVLPWGIPLVFGEEYNVSVPYAQALMCTIAFANVSPLRYQFLLSRIDPQSIKTVNVVMSLTRIASAVILIPFFGIVGAVISAFIHRIASTVAVQVIIRKRYPFPKQAVPL